MGSGLTQGAISLMCHYVNLVLPADADTAAIREALKRHRRVLEPTNELHVARVLASNERAYITTLNCDCGTGLAFRPREPREHDEDREVARQRRKGWSEAKIRRWSEQRTQAAERKVVSDAKSREEDAGHWLALVTDLLDTNVDHLGLLVHWLTDDVRRGPVLTRTQLDAQAMLSLEENVLYTFTRRG